MGKLTVAHEIRRRTGAVVVDNHLVNDPVFVPLGMDGAQAMPDGIDDLRRTVMEVVHEAIVLAPDDVDHVLTNWLDDSADDARIFDERRALAARRGATFVPVWLEATDDVLLQRVVQEDRRRRAKLRDVEIMREVLAVKRMAAPADALVIDTSTLTVEQVVDHILEP